MVLDNSLSFFQCGVRLLVKFLIEREGGRERERLAKGKGEFVICIGRHAKGKKMATLTSMPKEFIMFIGRHPNGVRRESARSSAFVEKWSEGKKNCI